MSAYLQALLRPLRILRYLIPPFFICWHCKMSRPFTRDGETYRVCLRCGVRRQFDAQEWKTKGHYYHPRERQNRNAPLRESKPRLQLIEGGIKHDAADSTDSNTRIYTDSLSSRNKRARSAG